MLNEQDAVVFALCGSFCTFSKVLPQMERLAARGTRIIPVMSSNAASLDTRFGRASEWKEKIREITGMLPLETLAEVEPLGPKRLACAMVIAPCTGATLARLDLGLGDTPVTLAAKSMLRNGSPIVVGLSTNDGLGASAVHIGRLMARKNFYLVPFSQDDCIHKPNSLQCDFDLLPDALDCALRGRQLQPVLL